MLRAVGLTALVFVVLYLAYQQFGKDLEKELRKGTPKEIGKSIIKDPCVFLETDIVNEKVYSNLGQKISANKKIECGQCKDYIHRDENGCSPYQKDFLYAMVDRDTEETVHMCSSLSFPEECKFKSPRQN